LRLRGEGSRGVVRAGKYRISKSQLVRSNEGKESIVTFDVDGGPLSRPLWDSRICPDTETRDDMVMDVSPGSVCGARSICRVPLIWVGPGMTSGAEA
jgi:hypothetical protein